MSMRFKTMLAVSALALASSGLSVAQSDSTDQRWQQLDPETRDALLTEWESKTPEQQDAIKQRAKDQRDRWNKMTPEQQQKLKDHRNAKAEEWKQMSDDEKAEARKRFQERRANHQAEQDSD